MRRTIGAMPSLSRRAIRKSNAMYVVSLFEHNLNVELAITALEKAGMPRAHILAAAVEKEQPGGKFFDTMYVYNAKGQFDLPMILGTMAALMGCVYGFALRWGPVIWGTIGGIAGFVAGLLIKLAVFKKNRQACHTGEVVIIAACQPERADEVMHLLRKNGALGVSKAGGAAPYPGADTGA